MRLAALALFFTTTTSGVAFAQSVQPVMEVKTRPNGLYESAWSLTVGPINGRTPQIPGVGMWYGVSPAARIGLFATGDVISQQNSGVRYTQWGVSLNPTLRYALAPQSRVVPFWQAGLQLGLQASPDSYGNQHVEPALAANVGLGVEYFIVPSISIGGYWGIEYNMDYDSNDSAWDYTFQSTGPAAELSLFF